MRWRANIIKKKKKAKILQHYKWLVANARNSCIDFTKKENDMNMEIWKILLDIKTKENKDD